MLQIGQPLCVLYSWADLDLPLTGLPLLTCDTKLEESSVNHSGWRTLMPRQLLTVLTAMHSGNYLPLNKLPEPDSPGYEQWRLTCDQWTSDWRRRSGVLRSDRHGGNS